MKKHALWLFKIMMIVISMLSVAISILISAPKPAKAVLGACYWEVCIIHYEQRVCCLLIPDNSDPCSPCGSLW